MGNCASSCCPGLFCRLELSNVTGRDSDQYYEPALSEQERDAVADLLHYLENVRASNLVSLTIQRGDTDFFSGEPLRALTTLVYSDNIDLQRSASLTLAEITEHSRSFWHMQS
jgi:vacuolar protein 8